MVGFTLDGLDQHIAPSSHRSCRTPVATEPFAKYSAAPVIDGSNQAVVIPLDIKHHPTSPYDAGVSVIQPCFWRIDTNTQVTRRPRPLNPAGVVAAATLAVGKGTLLVLAAHG
jgi:hypothetical protein